MYLITGGAYQVKSNYAVSVFKFDNNSIADGKTVDFEEINKYLCIKNFHILVRRMMKDGKTTEEIKIIVDSLDENTVIITDEIGNGIIPVDQFERDWREQTGRICCYIVSQSRKVVRLTGGIPVIIKDESK